MLYSTHLTTTTKSNIMFFGYAQGGGRAARLALLLAEGNLSGRSTDTAHKRRVQESLCISVLQNSSFQLESILTVNWNTLQRQFRLYIPFLGIAWPQPQFPHSCVCERFIYSQDQSTYFLQQKRQTHRGNILFAHRHIDVEIGKKTPIFLF